MLGTGTSVATRSECREGGRWQPPPPISGKEVSVSGWLSCRRSHERAVSRERHPAGCRDEQDPEGREDPGVETV